MTSNSHFVTLLTNLEQQVLEFIRHIYDFMGWPGVVVLMAIESACIPLPSELIMPLSGWILIAERGLGAYYIVIAGLYGALGNLIGSLIAYFVGAWGGRPFIERYGKYVLLSQHDLELADRWFKRYGSLAIFFSRLLPVVRTFISLPAGIARMPLLKFVAYTFLGSFPWSAGLAYGGYALGVHWEEISATIRPIAIAIVVIIVLLFVAFIGRRIYRARASP